MPKARTPLEVVVKDGRYTMFGTHTYRHHFLAEVLKRQGGVNESVADGIYHYNVKRQGFHLTTSLLPVITD